MSLFDELKRRRVFRLIAAYVVFAWVIIQVVTAIEEPLNLPDWFDTAVIVLLGLGFPIAIIMSWVYEVTPDGVVREDESGRRLAQIDYGKIALGAVLMLGAFMVGNYLNVQTDRPDRSRSDMQVFEISIPARANRIDSDQRRTTLTPDGRRILFVASVDNQRQIFARAMDSLDARPISGTEGTDLHFAVAPAGDFVAFSSVQDTRLQKVSIDGGIPTPLYDADRRIDHITWGDSGTIVFTETARRGLMKVSAGGGDAVEFVVPSGDNIYKHPSFVPGTDWLAFSVGGRGKSQSYTEPIGFVSLDGEVRMTSLYGSSPRVLHDGWLLYFHRNTVWSVRLDLDDLRVVGDPFPLVEDVYYLRFGHYDISDEGSLVYVRDSALGNMSLVWVNRDGSEEPTSLPQARYSFPTVSPDGDTIAVVEETPYGSDLWTHSLIRRESTRRTFDEHRESVSVWSPDGTQLYFESGSLYDLFRIRLNGNGTVEQLTDTPDGRFPASVLADGRILIDEVFGSRADGNNVGILDPDGDGEIQYLMQSNDIESHPKISPDGKMISYVSNRSGDLEVYVQRYPIDDGGWTRVSNSGDNWSPQWGADSRELYYWDRDDALMYSAAIDNSEELTSTLPVPLFDTDTYAWEDINNYDYDKTRGKFLMVKKPRPGSTDDEIILIQNWQTLLNDASAQIDGQ